MSHSKRFTGIAQFDKASSKYVTLSFNLTHKPTFEVNKLEVNTSVYTYNFTYFIQSLYKQKKNLVV